MQHRLKMLIYSKPLQSKTNKQIATTFCKTKGQNICRSKTQVSYNRLAYFYLSCKGLDFFPYSFYKSTSYPSLQYKFYYFTLAKHRKQIVHKINSLRLFTFIITISSLFPTDTNNCLFSFIISPRLFYFFSYNLIFYNILY